MLTEKQGLDIGRMAFKHCGQKEKTDHQDHLMLSYAWLHSRAAQNFGQTTDHPHYKQKKAEGKA